MSASVYVVEQGYDYEGNDAIWAGTSFDKAKAFADAVEGGDTVTISKWNDGLCTESWQRSRHERAYSHRRRKPDGEWENLPWV